MAVAHGLVLMPLRGWLPLVKLSGLQGIHVLCLLMNFRDVSRFHTGNLFTHAVFYFSLVVFERFLAI